MADKKHRKKERSKNKNKNKGEQDGRPESRGANRINGQVPRGQGGPTATQELGVPPAPLGYYLRVEGLNIYACTADTEQLSVARGASLLLRQATRDIEKRLEGRGEAISTGASVGEYRLTATDPVEVEKIEAEIAGMLNQGDYAHLTFAIVSEPILQQQSPEQTRERALARIRFRQMRMPTLVPPQHNEINGVSACGWEGRRPADAAKPIQRPEEDPIPVSSSVRSRYDYGKEQKHHFYREETRGADDGSRYTNDLTDLADLSAARNLNAKVAIIYADGNRFSYIRGKTCRNFDELHAFDEKIQGLRREFLAELLQRIGADPAFNTEDAPPKRRIETLLWGGDEFLLVVPAWRGLDVLQGFYATSATWEHQGWSLTHAAGIVYCRAKTPIDRGQALARQLAERVKARLKAAASGKSQDARVRSQLHNAYDYIVLESVDFPTEQDLDRFFADRYNSAAPRRDHLRPLSGWLTDGASTPSRKNALALLESLSRGQVYALARAAVATATDWADPDGVQTFQARCQRICEVLGRDRFGELASSVHALFGSKPGTVPEDCAQSTCDPWPWIHLAELWDYLAPEIPAAPARPGTRTGGGQ